MTWGGRVRRAAQDTIGQITATIQDIINVFWWQGNAETQLLKYEAAPLAFGGYWTWDVLYRLSTATSSLFQITGQALTKLWDLSIRPFFIQLYNGLVAVWDIVRLPLSTVAQGLRWLVDVLLQQFLVWLAGVRDAVAGIPAALRQFGGVLTAPVFELEAERFQAEQRARTSVDFLIGKHNTALDWLNMLVTESGVSREAQWAISAWNYAGDLLYMLIRYLIDDDLDDRIARDQARWKTVTGHELAVDFNNGSVRIREQLDQAVTAFRAAGAG